jgi:hypothetical protein
VSILDVLKRIRFPSFEEDFIQDQAEKILEETPVSYEGRMANGFQKDSKESSARKNLREFLNDEWDRHGDPSDGASMSNLDAWDE